MMWFLLLTAVSVLLWVYDRYSRRHLYRLANKLPGLRPWPIVGNLPILAGGPVHLYKTLKELGSLSIENKGVYSFWMGPILTLVLTDPDDIEKVLTTCLAKPSFYDNGVDMVGQGLVTIPDLKIWKRHRKAVLPSFNQTLLSAYIEVFNRTSMNLVRRLESHAGGEKFDPSEGIAIATLDSICALNQVLKMTFHRAIRVWLYFDFVYNRTAHGKLLKEYLDGLHKLPASVLLRNKEQKQNDLENGSYDNDSANCENDSKKKSLIHRLINSSTRLTDEEIKDEVTTIILAAYDTTSLTATMILQTIGSYPEVQNKVVAELDTIFDGYERPITKEDLSKMNYLEWTIKETMRLYSVTPTYGRSIDRDMKLKHYTIPQGASAYMFMGSVHTNEAIWGPDVMEFKPERWAPELASKRHSCSFLPFSFGPRNCIGFQYAMMSLKIMLACVLRTYIVTADINSVELGFAVLSGPKNGTLVQISKRYKRNIGS